MMDTYVTKVFHHAQGFYPVSLKWHVKNVSLSLVNVRTFSSPIVSVILCKNPNN